MTTPLLALMGSVALASVDSAPLATRLERQAAAYFDLGRFNGSVLVAQDGKPVLRRGYGYANKSWQIANAPETKFRIASITKPFTAAAILLLEQDGKLSTDAPVSRYLPDCPEAWKEITIHHLLTHTSGIKSYTNLSDFSQRGLSPVTDAGVLSLLAPLPLEFPPGSKFAYNNSGYYLLGMVVERVSGMKYEEFLARRIFQPVGMTDSGYFEHRKVIDRMAEGYIPGGQRAPFMDSSWPYSAGGLYSTVDDLLRWDQALYGDTPLTKASKEKSFRPYLRDYGYGWAITDRDGVKVVQHGGGIEGFSTVLERVPEKNITVVVLANVNGPAQRLGDDLVEIALGGAPAVPHDRPNVALSEAEIGRLAGVFQKEDSSDRLKLFARGRDLFVKADRQPEFALRCESATVLYIQELGVDLVAEMGASSTAEVIAVRQGKSVTQWRRVVE